MQPPVGPDPEGGGEDGRNLRRRVTSAFGATSAIIGVDAAIHVVFTAILARILSPAEFGVAAAATVFVTLITLFSHMGIAAALVQAPAITDRQISVGGTMVVVSATLWAGVGLFMAPLAGAWFRNPDVTDVVRLLVVGSVAQALGTPPNALLIRTLRAKALSLADVTAGVLAIGLVAIPMALAGAGFWALAFGAVVHDIVRTVLLWIMVRAPRLMVFDWGEARRLWSRSSGFLLTNIMQRVANEADRLIIGRYLTAVDLGLYSRATNLMTYPSRFYGTVLDRVAFPAFALLQLDRKRIQVAYLEAISLTALIGWPLALLLLLLGRPIIHFIFGDVWLGAVEPFRILCVGMYFRLSSRVNGALLRGAGRPYVMSLTQAAFCVFTVVGASLGFRYGIAGVAVGIVVAVILSDLLLTGLALGTAGLGLARFLLTQVHGLASALLVTSALWPVLWLARLFGLSSFLTLAAAGVVLAAVGLIAVSVFPAIFLGEAGRRLMASITGGLRAGLARRGVNST